MITQTLTTSFKVQVLQGIHNFGTTTSPYNGDNFYIALYSSTASLGADTSAYSTTGEITNTSGSAYVAGGQLLTVSTVPSAGTGTTAFVSFNNVTWTSASFTTAGALIYNASKGNKTVAVLNFGGDKTVTGSSFVVQFPAAAASTAIIRIV